MDPLSHVFEAESRTLRLLVPGDLLSTNVESLRKHCFEFLDAHPTTQTLEVDLRRATMVDSVGLNLLVLMIRQVKKTEGKVRLLIADESLMRVFRFTRLTSQAEVQFLAQVSESESVVV
jgi:anti-anti-sigma factor